MNRQRRFPLDLKPINESSNASLVQDLNSASSLSWAEDEVENTATCQVQRCLDNLENYLCSGRVQIVSPIFFDKAEAEQWSFMIGRFDLVDRLQGSKKIASHVTKVPSAKNQLAIKGLNFAESGKRFDRAVRSAVVAGPSSRQLPTSATTKLPAPNRSKSGRPLDSGLHLVVTSNRKEDEAHHLQQKRPKERNARPAVERRSAQRRPTNNKVSFDAKLPPLILDASGSRSPSPRKPSHMSETSIRRPSDARIPTIQTWSLRKLSGAFQRNMSLAPSQRTAVVSGFLVGVVGTSYDPVLRPARASNKLRISV